MCSILKKNKWKEIKRNSETITWEKEWLYEFYRIYQKSSI
jgi:hypothetical protein